MVSKAEQQNVAATFVSQYYKLLMADAQLVVGMYLPKANVEFAKHVEQDVSAALRRLFPTPNHGRIVIKEARVGSTESVRSFAVVVTGTYHRRQNSLAEDFKEVFELQESQLRPKQFGICAVHRVVEHQKVEPKQWAQETPPMFAKAAPEEPLPPMPQHEDEPKPAPRATPAVAVAAAAAPAAAPPAPAPAASPVKEAEAPKAPKAPKASASPAAAADDEPPKSISMAERLRLAKAKGPATPGQPAAAPIRVEARSPAPSGAEAIALAAKEAEEAEKQGDRKPRRDGAKADKGEKSGEKRVGGERKPREDGAKPAVGSSAAERPRHARGDKPAGASSAAGPSFSAGADGDKARRAPRSAGGAGGGLISRSVVFFDVIVKGLHKDATDATVEGLIGPLARIEKVNVISQPDKTDASVTRTFAFVRFNRTDVEDSSALVTKVVQACRANKALTKDRIQVDAVREKYQTADKEAGGSNAAAAAAAPAQ